MKLITKEVENKLNKFPFGTQDGRGRGAELIVKFFYPYGRGTWLITEAEKQEDGDWLFYGLCNIYEWEWGYVTLSDLLSIEFMGYPAIERDLYASKTVGEELKSMGVVAKGA